MSTVKNLNNHNVIFKIEMHNTTFAFYLYSVKYITITLRFVIRINNIGKFQKLLVNDNNMFQSIHGGGLLQKIQVIFWSL